MQPGKHRTHLKRVAHYFGMAVQAIKFGNKFGSNLGRPHATDVIVFPKGRPQPLDYVQVFMGNLCAETGRKFESNREIKSLLGIFFQHTNYLHT